MQAYVYILLCADNTLYTGWTNDIARRVEAHNQKKGAKYTASRLPVRLVYVEPCPSKQAALQREYAIKRMTREKKLLLIAAQKGFDPQAYA